jgi:hypothetical protein
VAEIAGTTVVVVATGRIVPTAIDPALRVSYSGLNKIRPDRHGGFAMTKE